MEDKQLDFNQPLLSVRRFSSTVGTSEAEVKRKTNNSLRKIPRLPFYKSELKSGPIRNPGTVPFTWEQTPGRPKDGSKSKSQAIERPPVAPKLPPGRILNVKQQALDKGSDSTKSTWTRTGNVPANSQSVSNSHNKVTKCESSIEEMEETASSSTEDSDEAYVDALETLSRTESFFLNCSVSGVSGLDGADLKPSGTFATDPQTRDFMMGRFLPAAKAMASETPPYSTRKPPIAREQPRPRIISVDKRLPIRLHSPNNVHFLAQDERLGESDDEDDFDEHENLSSSVCGLLPRFCLKNSFCLLNPVPGMRVQAQEPVVSVRGGRTQAWNSYSSSCSDNQNEKVRDAAYERRSRTQTADIQQTKLELKSEPNQKTYRNKGQNLDGSPLYSRFQGSVKSPNEIQSSQSIFSEPKRFVEVPEKALISEVNGSDPCCKGTKSFRELLTCQSTKWESGAASPIEKTLYIDSVHKVESPNSNSCSSDTRWLSDDRGDDFDSPVKIREIKGTLPIDSSLQDIKHLNLVDEKAILRHKSLESVDSNFLSSPARSARGMEIEVKSNSSEDLDLCKSFIKLTSPKVAGNVKIDLESKSSNQDISHGLIQDSVSSTSSKTADAGRIGLKRQLHPAVSSPESSHDNYSQLLLPLPLPKSPSDSWLKRTLPTVCKKNSPSWSSLGPCDYTTVQASSKTPSVNPKWETIVKTSNGHLRFSEELLAPIPEN
ncbi:hypothetical protein LWI29_022740 [Acer saccharum]|uniref:Uncharacterized protein n=1 Tax=Acer saccharum TaxID=4024 RepID=A0AA39SEB6_ACESA|nr:hypothetical protein LWI29_022740 [Acer saccharum]KAK1568037.1 hypothetical protein Q3G72_019770 [Acer saccharum]